MKKLFFLQTTFLLATLTIALPLTAAQLKFDRMEAKIELKPGEEEARALFKVTNEGDETVRISRVKTSCGCTGSILDRKILDPDQSTEIIATFNKGKRRGINTNRLEVYVDDEPSPVATLRMTVSIPELIKSQPEIVYWNASTTKTPKTITLTLDDRYLNEISEIVYDQSVLELERSEDSQNILLEISPKAYDQSIRSSITVSARGDNGVAANTRIHVFVQP